MTYPEVLDFLYSSLPMYQRTGSAAYKSDLKTSYDLDNYFGNPHKKFKSIHIAGTNGKGSVSHMLTSVLQAAGYKTGLYTSPHIRDFRERIRINGIMVSEVFVTDFVNHHQEIIRLTKPSFFEMTVAMAFNYFADQQVDIAVIETGMGGRLDSTNIITPLVSVITNISFDHTQFLGESITEIANEKAGIIKEEIPLIIGESQTKTKDLFIERARKKSSGIFFADDCYTVDNIRVDTDNNQQCLDIYQGKNIYLKDLLMDLGGEYQQKNLLSVLKVLDILKPEYQIFENMIRQGISSVQRTTAFEGRWQILGKQPFVVCDTAHNTAGIIEVIMQLKKISGNMLHMIIGFVNDKDADKILSLLPQNAVYYFTRAGIPRALDESELRSQAAEHNLFGESFSTVDIAFDSATRKAGSEDVIFIGGSTFIVADFLSGQGSKENYDRLQ